MKIYNETQISKLEHQNNITLYKQFKKEKKGKELTFFATISG